MNEGCEIMANMQAMCGLDCETCKHREKMHCAGCNVRLGKMFWGECPIAKCCISKNVSHCGVCPQFVCQTLHDYAFDKEHGDHGQRIENLRARKAGGK
jgi:hypothetical protein